MNIQAMVEIQNRFDAMRLENEELRKDKDRLDWIEKEDAEITTVYNDRHSAPLWSVDFATGSEVAETIRGAIDAAMGAAR